MSAAAGTRERSTLTRAVWLVFALALAFHYQQELLRVGLLAYASAIIAVALGGLAKKLPLERKWMAVVVALTLLTTLALAIWFGGGALLEQARDLSNRLPELEQRLRALAARIEDKLGLNVQLMGPEAERLAQDAVGAVEGRQVLSKFYGLVGVIAVSGVVFMGGMFALARPNELLTPLLRVFPPRTRDRWRRFFDLLTERLRAWVRGQLIAMAAVGTVATVAFMIIGVPYALLLGVLNGLLEFIPILGPWLAGIPAVTIAFLDDPAKGAWTAVAVVAIQQLETQVLTPLVMSRTTEVHPFVTLLAILLFGSLFGFVGVLLALPLVLLIWTSVQVFWVEGSLQDDLDTPLEPVAVE